VQPPLPSNSERCPRVGTGAESLCEMVTPVSGTLTRALVTGGDGKNGIGVDLGWTGLELEGPGAYMSLEMWERSACSVDADSIEDMEDVEHL
jgi:hypothetical protein